MLKNTAFYSQLAEGVKELSPYQPGKPIAALQRELGIDNIVKLASNENPLGCSQKVVAAISEGARDVHRYPDGSAYELREAIVEYHAKPSVGLSHITLGNGSNDVLELIGRAFLNAGDHAVYSEYAFAVYALTCKAMNVAATEVPAKAWGHDLEALLSAVRPETKIVFLANPNNPTGTWFDVSAWEWFLSRIPPHTLVVLDEAYAEYIQLQAYPEGVHYLEDYPNLIVCKTFSKVYGLAGLRVGYALSSIEIADYLNRVRQPFNVNSLALNAAVAALSDQAFVEQSRVVNSEGLTLLSAGLDALDVPYIPSVANFICVDMEQAAQPIFQQLLQKGVIVRPVTNYGLEHFLRVSVGNTAEIEVFLQALQDILS